MKCQLSDLKKIASQIRRDVIRMIHNAASGHPGGSLGCVEYFVTMYWEIMKHHISFDMNGKGEDLLFVSNGHVSPAWYSTLARCGYFKLEELNTFRKINSKLQGHPSTKEGLPGIRMASGSLGQGLSVAIGAALSKKLNQDPRYIYVLLSDGELQEGQIWEGAIFAAHYKVDNLIATVDINGKQIDGSVEEVMSLKNLTDKWKAFGWRVFECDGNDIEKVISTLKEALSISKRGYPIINLMRTTMGFGVDFMENDHRWHGIAPNSQETIQALNQLPETIGDY